MTRQARRIVNLPIRSLLKRGNVSFAFVMILVVIAVSTALLSLRIMGRTYHYTMGDIARETVRVDRDIHYIDEAETKRRDEALSESVPLVFDKDVSVLQEQLRRTGILFAHIRTTLEENPPIGTDDLSFQLMALKSRLPESLQYNDAILLGLMQYRDPMALKKIAEKVLLYIYDANSTGIIAKPLPLSQGTANRSITVRFLRSTSDREEVRRVISDVRVLEDIRDRLYAICYGTAPNLPRPVVSALARSLSVSLSADITFNREETRRRIAEKIQITKPVMGHLKKGQIIVREGDTVTIDMMQKIRILNRYAQSSHASFIVGTVIIQLIFAFIFLAFLVEFSELLIPDKKSSLILFSVVIIFSFYTFFLSGAEGVMDNQITFVLLLPIPFVTMLLGILYNIYLAMLVGIHIVFFTVMISGGDMSTLLIASSTAILGVFVNIRVQRRTDFLRGGLIMGGVNSVVVVSILLMNEMPLLNAFSSIQLSMANGLINSILVLGLLPAYENIFGITTRFKLLELSDLNAGVFKRMLIEAPGTYNHSLLVATMAENACREIQANYLLARVGSYYHDIGKIDDAGLYIENRVTDARAATLSSQEYCGVIISHVEKGVRMARKIGLPEAVTDFIREHHGNTTMTYFYHKALEEAEQADELGMIQKEDFQYPGPKPHSRETAVVMLADAVEAASRSLKDRGQDALSGMVRKIIYNRLNEGDLDNSDLSMSELSRIEQTFISFLTGLFHTRLAYPDEDRLRKLEEKAGENGSRH